MNKLSSLLFVVIAEMAMSAPSAEANKLSPPTELVAVTSLKVDGAVELSWHAVKGATEYTISASRETDGNWRDVGTTTKTVFQLDEMPQDTRYYFRIASNTKSGQSDWSSPVMQYSSGKKRIHSLLLPAAGRSSTESTYAVAARILYRRGTEGVFAIPFPRS